MEEQNLVNTALVIQINSDVIKRNNDKNFPPKMKPVSRGNLGAGVSRCLCGRGEVTCGPDTAERCSGINNQPNWVIYRTKD